MANADRSVDVYHSILRSFERVRKFFARGAGAADAATLSGVDAPLVAVPLPAPQAEPVAAPPRVGTCGVYLWATAHGIDLSYPGPLGSCTCSGKPHPEPSHSEALRAKVREANAASRWGK
ncbi:hypothetical protein ACSNOH_31300 [Streptomyces sp. URMC 127]|uniref:hypothetical protein n=1 Tax=Streptomyces sp. URMC 127 TaxID=3423402 RepID=UPI003F1A6F6A